MSNGKAKKVSLQDLQLVQNLIEMCIQLYMKPNEVVDTLQRQAKIEPNFTKLVWQKLEEENPEFFRAYNIRLILIDQIQKFNKLLEAQADLMTQGSPVSGADSVSISNGMRGLNLGQNRQLFVHQNSSCNATDNSQARNLENMHQNPNVGIMHGMNGEESDPKPVNEQIVESDPSLFGVWSNISRNFSLSDLTTDFSTISSDILDSYSGSPYLESDTEFLNPLGNGDNQG